MSTSYFLNVNVDLLTRLPVTARRVLEVGCGAGFLGAAYLARNPRAEYIGVELNAGAATAAAQRLSRVIIGDIESAEIVAQLSDLGISFDLVVLGDVIEHLRDPWKALRDLQALTAPGGVCVACVPNVAHWSVLVQQLQGRWNYTDDGLLDHTHLRFFTLATLWESFQQAGWTVVDAKSRIVKQEETDSALAAFRSLAKVLDIPGETIDLHLSAYQWVLRAINGPAVKPLQVVGVGLAKVAGCNEARIDYPLAALNTLPDIRAKWGELSVGFNSGEPGVMIFQRRYFNDATINKQIDSLIAAGFAVVLDVDDDPRGHEWVETDYYAFKRVHAVTVSTEALASMARFWNPNVAVFPNAVFQLPEPGTGSPPQRPPRIFFGALNREADWESMIESLIGAALECTPGIEFVVVHDRAFFDRIPPSISKVFHPTLSHDEYLDQLKTCDIALLPLADTEFNHMKSDLKLIECAACCVVAVCSPTVYGDNPDHAHFAQIARSPADWGNAIRQLCADPGLRQRMREQGYAYVKGQRMHAYQADERRRYYFALMEQLPALEQQRQQRMQVLKWRPENS